MNYELPESVRNIVNVCTCYDRCDCKCQSEIESNEEKIAEEAAEIFNTLKDGKPHCIGGYQADLVTDLEICDKDLIESYKYDFDDVEVSCPLHSLWNASCHEAAEFLQLA